MSVDLFKELIPNILREREPLDLEEKDYVPYLVNRALSANLDTVLFANQINQYPNCDRKMQYDYLFHSVRKYKRGFHPWVKPDNHKALLAVCEYFQCSKKKGKETINILTDTQIQEIVSKVSSKDSGVKQ